VIKDAATTRARIARKVPNPRSRCAWTKALCWLGSYPCFPGGFRRGGKLNQQQGALFDGTGTCATSRKFLLLRSAVDEIHDLLLSSLPAKALAHLQAHLDTCELPRGTAVELPGRPTRYAHFFDRGFASVLLRVRTAAPKSLSDAKECSGCLLCSAHKFAAPGQWSSRTLMSGESRCRQCVS
jgi:hypothetical protein